MAYTVGYALFGALLCTLALIPGLAYSALRKPRPVRHNRTLEWLTAAYRATLARLIDRPKLSWPASSHLRSLRSGFSAHGRAGVPA